MKELIQKLANNGDEIYAKICEVISVDVENQTADLKPLDGSAEILERTYSSGRKWCFCRT